MRLVRLIGFLLLWPLATNAASEAGFPLYDMTPNLADQGSLQRGAQTYMNYCLGCHSLKYQRYKRTAEDIGVPESLMLQHLVFDPNTKIGSLIENSISRDNAKTWFGAVPPDLTLYTQLKGGPEYLYTYLLTFYEDPSRPLGANNLVYENAACRTRLLSFKVFSRKFVSRFQNLRPMVVR
jgi:cytochrome c1